MEKKNNARRISVNIESLLICPQCSHRIIRRREGFYCEKCKSIYPIKEGVTVLLKSLNEHKRKEAEYHSSVSRIYNWLHQLQSYRNIYYHRQSLKPILELGPNVQILEVGCGTGYDASFLLKKGQTVVATDISVGQVLEAKKEILRKGLATNAHFYIVDAENIPFLDESFNATITFATLHHLEHPLKALLEMRRCTKKDGIIIIAMEPNRFEWLCIIGYGFAIFKKITFFLLGKRVFKNILKKTVKWCEPNVERTFSKKEILSLIKEAGLEPEGLKGIWFTCGFIHWIITLLNKLSKKTWYVNRDIERIFVSIDEFITKIPIINLFACNWTLFCRKKLQKNKFFT